MNDGNYIKINRSILEWEWYKNINTKVLFLHMLLKANWKDGKFEGIIVARGSFVSSYPMLAMECDLTINEIRTALKHLINTGEITVKPYHKYSVFIINKYCMYQDINSQLTDESQTNHSQSTDNAHSINRRLTTIEEKKEGKKGRKEEGKNNNTNVCENLFNDFFAAYPKQNNIVAAEKEYMIVLFSNPKLSEEDLMQSAKNYAEAVKIQNTDSKFIKDANNFLKDGKYLDYLPENYKRPTEKKNKNKFGKFEQNNYDFDALEKELMSN